MIKPRGLVLLLSSAVVLWSCNTATQQPPVAVEPGTVAAAQLYQAGRVAYEAANYDEAAEKFARVASADPEHLKALINWGVALSRGDKPLQAIPKFQQALARDPDNAAAYYNWGVALERMRKHREAIEKYEQALALRNDLLTPTLQQYLQRHRPLLQDTEISPAPSLAPPSR